jgi:hypothetical protein
MEPAAVESLALDLAGFLDCLRSFNRCESTFWTPNAPIFHPQKALLRRVSKEQPQPLDMQGSPILRGFLRFQGALGGGEKQ